MSKSSPKTDVDMSGKQTAPTPKQVLDPMMLNALLCPKTRTPLTYDRETQELISKKASLAYPIREGVPIMLVEEARDISKKSA
ncbi:MAG: Trm112 family protein [Alphaproteobacteria bacterium]